MTAPTWDRRVKRAVHWLLGSCRVARWLVIVLALNVLVHACNRALAQTPISYSAEASYGSNPQQTLRRFDAPKPACGSWMLWWLNAGYEQDHHPNAIGPANEPLWSILDAGVTIVTATTTFPGQPGVPGGGRFLPPEHPNYQLGDRVERDAVAGTARALELAPAWGLSTCLWITGGRSGGTHPPLWATYRTWPQLAAKPRGVFVIGSHTWWPAWNQSLGLMPAHHFYHVADVNLTGAVKANVLSQTKLEDQVASSFLSYAQPIAVPCLWYSAEASVEVTALSPLPSNAIAAPHSPWFSMAGYAHLQAIAPHPLHRLLLDPAVAPAARANGLAAEAVTPTTMPTAVRQWAREVLFGERQ